MIRWSRVTVVVILALVIGVLAWNFDRVHFLLVARPATQEDIERYLDELDGYSASGFVHRWRLDGTGAPACIGTWVVYYGKSSVIHTKVEYGHNGWPQRHTVWLPNGKLLVQHNWQRDRNNLEQIDNAPWKGGERDQSIGTKQLRGCSFLEGWFRKGMRLDGLEWRGADLRETDLGECTFRGTDLRDAKLDGADLLGADLSGAKNLTVAQVLTAARWNMDLQPATRFPHEVEQKLTRLGLRSKSPSAGVK